MTNEWSEHKKLGCNLLISEALQPNLLIILDVGTNVY